MTYRSFCQPNELLDLLVERYKIPNPNGFEDKKDPISMKAMKTFKITYQTPIQLRYLHIHRRSYSFLTFLAGYMFVHVHYWHLNYMHKSVQVPLPKIGNVEIFFFDKVRLLPSHLC